MCPASSLSAVAGFDSQVLFFSPLSFPPRLIYFFQSDLNVRVKATYSAALSSGMGVAESSSLISIEEQSVVSRVQVHFCHII